MCITTCIIWNRSRVRINLRKSPSFELTCVVYTDRFLVSLVYRCLMHAVIPAFCCQKRTSTRFSEESTCIAAEMLFGIACSLFTRIYNLLVLFLRLNARKVSAFPCTIIVHFCTLICAWVGGDGIKLLYIYSTRTR